MMSFTRWKEEQLVLDLYNHGKTGKEIAKTVLCHLEALEPYP